MSYPAGIDLIVCNYRTAADLASFLTSLEEHPPGLKHTVTIAQVTPGELDAAIARDFCDRHRTWTVLRSETNVGYNIACNTAGTCQPNPHELVACFNADTRITEGALDLVSATLMSHPQWAIAGPRQVDDAGRLTAGGIFGTGAQPRHRGWHATAGHTDTRDDCITVSGAAFFIKREVWDELRQCPVHQEIFPKAAGPLGEQHHFYGETTCCYHARAHGYGLGYVGSVTMVHNHMGAGRVPTAVTAADRELFRRFCHAHSIECD